MTEHSFAQSSCKCLANQDLPFNGFETGSSMMLRAVNANREINQILSLSKIPDDPQYRASRLAFDLQAVASERLELETRVSPYDLLPGNANPASSDPFLESLRDKRFSRLSTLREEERELQQRLKREQQRQFVSPTQSLTELYDAPK